MIEFDLQHAQILRLALFFALLAFLLWLQYILPRRVLPRKRWSGQLNNLVLVGLGNVLIRLCLPFGLVALSQMGIAGLLPTLGIVGLPALCIGLLLLDGAIYWQHRFFHQWPLLWRLHRVHHSDSAFEVTTAVRFHPLELLLSYLLKAGLVLLLGIDALTILIFEILLSSTALFSHSNLALPKWMDDRVRLLLVTPDMHRIHHSQLPAEHNSNYGFSFSFWDRLFGSYTREPKADHATMAIGLSDLADGNLARLLGMPFFPHRQRAAVPSGRQG